jgi:hypothetical protein
VKFSLFIWVSIEKRSLISFSSAFRLIRIRAIISKMIHQEGGITVRDISICISGLLVNFKPTGLLKICGLPLRTKFGGVVPARAGVFLKVKCVSSNLQSGP